jgi:5-formyltetrahydrofolate cyclo-ligase
MLARRRALDHAAWLASSSLAQRNLLSLPEYGASLRIALYLPVNNEVDTSHAMRAGLDAGKLVLCPAVRGDRMLLRRVEDTATFGQGAFGVPEPPPAGVDRLADEADLIVVPGVVFDINGHRIGYGKGFYDRFLLHPGRTATLVGLCHDFQLLDEALPSERHDVRMDIIVTDRRIVFCGGNRSRKDGPDSHRGGT